MRVAGALMLAALAVGSSPVRVVGGADDFMRPAAGGGYLAWSQNSRANPRHFDAFVRRGRTTWKMNAPHTSGSTGGIDRGHVVFAQIRGGSADLYDYDIDALRRHRINRVSTAQWESDPTMSHNRILFTRIDYVHHRFSIVLFNARTRHERVLDQVGGHAVIAGAGQVSGDFAVWDVCVEGGCRVYRFDRVHKRTVEVSARAVSSPQYAPSVTPQGVVYFVRSGANCGSSVELRRWRRARVAVLARLRRGLDVTKTYAVRRAGRTTIYFDGVVCRTDRSAIYKVTDDS